MQWVADSHIAVIGHGHQDEGFRAGEAWEEVHLQEAGGEAEEVVPTQKQGQHLGDGSCGGKDLHDRERLIRENVRGLVESGLCTTATRIRV